ncbi:MAG: protein YgfX [Endozoicomonas sp.]
MGETRAILCEVNTHPSRCLFLLAAGSHGTAIVALWLSSLLVLGKVLLTTVLLIHLFYFLHRYILLKHGLSVLAVRLYQDHWRVQLAGGWHRAWPAGEVVVTSFLICMKMKCEGSHRPVSLILFPDSGSAAELHGLRLRLMLDRSRLFPGGKDDCPGSE